MTRRKFILFLATLPLLGFLKPTEAEQSADFQKQFITEWQPFPGSPYIDNGKHIWVSTHGSDKNDGSSPDKSVDGDTAMRIADATDGEVKPILIMLPETSQLQRRSYAK